MFVKQKDTHPAASRFDLRTIVTGVIVPILVVFIGARVDRYRATLAVLFGLAMALLGLAPHLRARFQRWRDDQANARLARDVAPKLQTLVNRFGVFPRSDRGKETVHSILRAELSPALPAFAAMRIGDDNLLYSWWYTLNRRVASSRSSITAVLLDLDDLQHLVSTYKRECLDPIFERPTPEFLGLLDGRLRADLNGAREQFNAYLARVEEVAEHVSGKVKSLTPPRFHIERSKPLH